MVWTALGDNPVIGDGFESDLHKLLKPAFVVFFVKRGIQTVYAEVEPDWTREKR